MCQGGRPTVSVVSRSAGRSATAAVAYRAAAQVTDLRTGDAHDFRRKRGVEAVVPFLPVVAEAGQALPPHLERLHDVAALWQAAEAAETRSNSRVARELLVPLPHELDAQQRRELVEGIAADIAARYGVAGTACIHLPDAKGDQRNFHAHILFTTRRVDLATGQLAEKTRELDDRKTGPQEIEALVAMAEQRINQALESAQLERRVDFRSLKDRHAEAVASGDEVKAVRLDYAPQTHEGPQVTAIRREAEQRRALAVRDGLTLAADVEDEPLTLHVLGECRTIEANEAAKASKAAALEEAAALSVVLDARAAFEAARAEADRARAAGELEEAGQPELVAAAVGQDWSAAAAARGRAAARQGRRAAALSSEGQASPGGPTALGEKRERTATPADVSRLAERLQVMRALELEQRQRQDDLDALVEQLQQLEVGAGAGVPRQSIWGELRDLLNQVTGGLVGPSAYTRALQQQHALQQKRAQVAEAREAAREADREAREARRVYGELRAMPGMAEAIEQQQRGQEKRREQERQWRKAQEAAAGRFVERVKELELASIRTRDFMGGALYACDAEVQREARQIWRDSDELLKELRAEVLAVRGLPVPKDAQGFELSKTQAELLERAGEQAQLMRDAPGSAREAQDERNRARHGQRQEQHESQSQSQGQRFRGPGM